MERIVGPDAGRQWLDGHLAESGRRLRVTNDPKGIERLVGELAGTEGCPVVMASGGCERIAHRALTARGVATAIVDPCPQDPWPGGQGGDRQEPIDPVRGATPARGPARAGARRRQGCRDRGRACPPARLRDRGNRPVSTPR